MTHTHPVKQQTQAIVWAILSLLPFAAPAHAEEEVPAPVAPVAAPAAPATQLNPIAQAFAQSGVQRCLGRVDQVTKFLTNGSSASAGFLFIPPAQQDNSMLSTSMEIVSGNTFSYASTSYHPRPTADNCGALYETVTYWQVSCPDLASSQYTALRKAEVLQTKVTMLDGGPNMRVFLMPAGTGCVAIKKEVIY